MPRVSQFGFIFDVDGVFVRGGRVLERAKQALSLITDSAGVFQVPTLFVTNAGNMTRLEKATKLNAVLGSRISPDQIVMSHSPLRYFKNLHHRHILGSGPNVVQIGKFLGFQKISTVDDIRFHFPDLDAFNYHSEGEALPEADRRTKKPFERIEAIVLFEEPKRWETHLQLLIDLIMMNGDLNGQTPPENVPKLPVIACSKDMVWMSEANLPRFAHGSFLFALETLYQQIAGKPLQYYAVLGKPSPITYANAEAKLHELARVQAAAQNSEVCVRRIYCVGDNMETDICGANWYNRMLMGARHRNAASSQVSASKHDAAVQKKVNLSEYETRRPDLRTLLPASRIDECISILVRTGVSSFQARRSIRAKESQQNKVEDSEAEADRLVNSDSETDWLLTSERLRKMMRLPQFTEPRFVVDDVYDAVRLAFEHECKSTDDAIKSAEQRSTVNS